MGLTHCKVCGVGGCSYLNGYFYLAVNKACKGISLMHNWNPCGSEFFGQWNGPEILAKFQWNFSSIGVGKYIFFNWILWFYLNFEESFGKALQRGFRLLRVGFSWVPHSGNEKINQSLSRHLLISPLPRTLAGIVTCHMQGRLFLFPKGWTGLSDHFSINL